ncbi:NAD(+)--rifampin ADP-ribosyltransferase [Chryseobacterium culicis]|uniref:Rifampin ADP-ribosylating transferase n=1 Tax=Chryseobacterium culicis TaxID=680127 RepID=A0A1H6HA21_CHRCI|nr:NAD(+)--rifampin ADP-ribosyltransferase [Chryseobacterium culicis]SEH32657.1 rifampin ADP-ribosylating transferase [Chryseobacterium culicis]
MEFSPFNPVIRLCLQGMSFEEKEMPEEAIRLFLQAWEEASDDHEKFLAAHYVARHQKTVADRLQWLETSLEFALKINDDTVKSALPALYQNISKCWQELGDAEKSKKNAELSLLLKNHPSDKGPFYHGTKADLKIGDLLTAGGNSNYQSELKMNHIYFTALTNGAGLAAALAKGDGAERVYLVEPTGDFENDPNVTDKKFPGNPTRSYRSAMPLKIIGEITQWNRPTSEDLQKFREKLKNSSGEIIN